MAVDKSVIYVYPPTSRSAFSNCQSLQFLVSVWLYVTFVHIFIALCLGHLKKLLGYPNIWYIISPLNNKQPSTSTGELKGSEKNVVVLDQAESATDGQSLAQPNGDPEEKRDHSSENSSESESDDEEDKKAEKLLNAPGVWDTIMRQPSVIALLHYSPEASNLPKDKKTWKRGFTIMKKIFTPEERRQKADEFQKLLEERYYRAEEYKRLVNNGYNHCRPYVKKY